MKIFESLILGIIEGLTEFLPISSTAHLILMSKILSLPNNDFQKFFEVFIQSGAILAVILYYLKFIYKNKNLIFFIIISFIPTAIIGFSMHEIIKNYFFENLYLIMGMLIGIGIIFIIIEELIKNQKINLNKEINNLNYPLAIIIGLFQGISIIPGVSRAATVIIIMLLLGFKRQEAVIYSFLLAVPTILGAGIFDAFKILYQKQIILSYNEIISILVGFITAFFSALLAIKFFLKYLEKNNLTIFGYYRIFIAILFFILLKLNIM